MGVMFYDTLIWDDNRRPRLLPPSVRFMVAMSQPAQNSMARSQQHQRSRINATTAVTYELLLPD